jgi:rhodanese-related sulfurtransferase
VTRGTVVALVGAAAGLTILSANGPAAHAIHVPGDAPLSIAPEDLQRYRDAGEEVVVIDLRAHSVPLGELRRREAEIPRAGRVVLYAGTPEEAVAAYQMLREAGYRNIMVLAGGLREWIRLGLPLESPR